jgi:hypothetical protein
MLGSFGVLFMDAGLVFGDDACGGDGRSCFPLARSCLLLPALTAALLRPAAPVDFFGPSKGCRTPALMDSPLTNCAGKSLAE